MTGDEGLGGQLSTHQATAADYDNDGDVDLRTSGWLCQNNGNSNNWLNVDLVGDGVNVNTTTFGAIVRVDTGGQIITRQVDTGPDQGHRNDSTFHFGIDLVNAPRQSVVVLHHIDDSRG